MSKRNKKQPCQIIKDKKMNEYPQLNSLFEFDELKKHLQKINKKKLFKVYAEYGQTTRYCGSQIWITGSIFIPLSLAGVISKSTDLFSSLSIAFFSILLIWIWYFLSSRIRSLLNRYFAVTSIIESILFDIDMNETKRGLIEYLNTGKKEKLLHLRHSRLIITICISVGWLVLSFISILNYLQK